MSDDSGEFHFRDPSMRGGFTILPNWLLRLRGLSDGAWRLYILLLSYAWDTDRCWPGQRTLAADLDASVRTVRYRLTELERAQLVTIEQRGLRMSNVYVIESWDDHPLNPKRGQPERQKAAAQDRQRGAGQERPDIADRRRPKGKRRNGSVDYHERPGFHDFPHPDWEAKAVTGLEDDPDAAE